jgi:hypothetical protein
VLSEIHVLESPAMPITIASFLDTPNDIKKKAYLKLTSSTISSASAGTTMPFNIGTDLCLTNSNPT